MIRVTILKSRKIFFPQKVSSNYFELIDLVEHGNYNAAKMKIRDWDSISNVDDICKQLINAEISIFEGSYESASNALMDAEYLNSELDDPVVTLIITVQLITLDIQSSNHGHGQKLIDTIKPDFFEKLYKSKVWDTDYINFAISRFYHTCGNFFQSVGNFKLAIRNYQDAIEIRKEVNDKKGLASSLNKLSIVYKNQGDLKMSYGLCMEALALEEEIGNKQALAVLYYTLGQLEREFGKYKECIEYLQKSLAALKIISNPYLLALLNFELFFSYLQLNKDTALNYKIELERISIDYPHLKSIQCFYLMANALYLKNSTRVKEKFQSQDFLRGLIEEDTLNYQIKILVMKNLMDLLIDELKLSNSNDILTELMSLLVKMRELAHNSQSYPLTVDLLLLESKFRLNKGDVEIADLKITEAIQISKERELIDSLEKAMLVKTEFEDSLKNYKEITTKGASILNRVMDSDIDSYLSSIPNMIHLFEA